jgi:hypothetical protein
LQDSLNHVVITSKEGQVGEIFFLKWIKVVGWTSDSRYLIVNFYDQYGDYAAWGFNTVRWKQIPIAPSATGAETCIWVTSGTCNEGATSISPDGQSVVLQDGTTVNLAELSG